MKPKIVFFFCLFLIYSISIRAQYVSYTTLKNTPPKLILLIGGDGCSYPYSAEAIDKKVLNRYGIMASGEYYFIEKACIQASYAYGLNNDLENYVSNNAEIRFGGEYYLYSKQKEVQTSVTLKSTNAGYNTKRITYIKVPSTRKIFAGVNLGYQMNNFSYDVFTGINFTLLNFVKIDAPGYGKKRTRNYLKTGFDLLFNTKTSGLVERSNMMNDKKNVFGYRFKIRYSGGNNPLFLLFEFGHQSATYARIGMGAIITPL